MNLIQAFVRNVGTLHVMLRENPISVDHEGGGSSCSSNEVSVMEMERRG